MKRLQLSSILRAIVLASGVAGATPTWADWEYAKWNMTADQVIAASGGSVQAVKEEKGKRIDNNYRLASGTGKFDGVDYVLDFYFDPKSNGLVEINFVPAKTACDAALTAHLAQFGKAKEEKTVISMDPRKPPLIQIVYQWETGLLGGDKVHGVDGSAKGMGIRYCQFLRMK